MKCLSDAFSGALEEFLKKGRALNFSTFYKNKREISDKRNSYRGPRTREIL